MPSSLRCGARRWLYLVLMLLPACASLAVRPCDTIEDRDGKYFGRFFLGVATVGLSEVTIQSEEIRQAGEGYPSCPPPPGVRVVSAPRPASVPSSPAVGTLVNGTRWTLAVYLNRDPANRAQGPFTILRPAESRQIGFQPGQHQLTAQLTGAPPGTLPNVTWSRRMDIDPRVRSFKLQFAEVDFK